MIDIMQAKNIETDLKTKKLDQDSSVTKRLLNYIKQSDMYGYNIRLNYEGEETYKSTLGGFLTIFTKLGIALFLIY